MLSYTVPKMSVNSTANFNIFTKYWISHSLVL